MCKLEEDTKLQNINTTGTERLVLILDLESIKTLVKDWSNEWTFCELNNDRSSAVNEINCLKKENVFFVSVLSIDKLLLCVVCLINVWLGLDRQNVQKKNVLKHF